MTDSHLKCSFCGLTQAQVVKIVAGPGVYICNRCVDLCNEILYEDSPFIRLAGTYQGAVSRKDNDGNETGPELQKLTKDAIVSLEALLEHFKNNSSPSAIEPVLRALLHLRALQNGSNLEDLLPILEELSKFYVSHGNLAEAANLLERSIEILDKSTTADKKVKDTCMLRLIKLQVKLGYTTESEKWLNRLEKSLSPQSDAISVNFEASARDEKSEE